MNVILIRHGATAGNALRRYIGRTDEPLSAEGIRQAKAAGNDPGLPLVYVTPLVRTQQTASILFPNARQIVTDGLQEMDFGIFEGRSASEMESDSDYRGWVDSGCLAPCPGGESKEAFEKRVQNAFAAAVSSHIRAEGADGVPAVFVVHGGTIMAILEGFARPSMSFYEGHTENAAGFRCRLIVRETEPFSFFLTDITRIDRIPADV